MSNETTRKSRERAARITHGDWNPGSIVACWIGDPESQAPLSETVMLAKVIAAREGSAMTPIDEACRALAEMAREIGLLDIVVTVRNDGRVWLHGTGQRGLTGYGADCDVRSGGALPLPSEALAKWRGDR